MKVSLIQPRSPRRYARGSRDGYNGPLGLASIATALDRLAAGHEVRVVDCEVSDTALDEATAADLVGITVTAFTVETALDVAAAAKRNGATVIMGGVHASRRPHHLLVEYSGLVDGVCIAQGEQAFSDLAQGVPFGRARNLVAQSHGALLRGPVEWLPRDLLPIDRDHLPMEIYLNAFARIKGAYCPDLPYGRPLPVFSQVGCAFRDATGGCLFCSRGREKSDMRSAENYWAEVAAVEAQYGADMIWDFADSFPANGAWLDAMARSRPRGLVSRVYLYARADELTDVACDRLAEAGAFQVLMGVETGDAALKAQKGTTTAQDVAAVARLSQRGIRIFPSYCLGLEGETRDSVRRTVAFAQQIAEVGRPWEIACSILLPLQGTPAFAKLIKVHPDARAARNAAYIPPEILQRWWLEAFCHVSLQDLIEAMHEILEMAPLKSTFGAPVMADRLPFCSPATVSQLSFDIRRATSSGAA